MRQAADNRWFDLIAIVLLALAVACDDRSPVHPAQLSLVGRWNGALSGRAPCVGDWTSFVLSLQATGSGEVVTGDGQRFTATEVIENGVTRLDVLLPAGTGECQGISLVISTIERDSGGNAIELNGQAVGRCCGTIATPFRLNRT